MFFHRFFVFAIIVDGISVRKAEHSEICLLFYFLSDLSPDRKERIMSQENIDSANEVEVKNDHQLSQLEIMEKNMKMNVKQAHRSLLAMIFTGGIFLVLLVAACIVVPPAIQTLNNVNTAINQLNGTVEQANASLSQIDDMTASITRTSDNVNKLVEDNTEDLTNSVEKLSEIDYDALNESVQDLKTSAAGLAKVMSFFN